MVSRYWAKTANVVTYDEGGGWCDHVRPPAVDRFAPLTERDRQASAFLEAFDFSEPPRAAIVLD